MAEKILTAIYLVLSIFGIVFSIWGIYIWSIGDTIVRQDIGGLLCFIFILCISTFSAAATLFGDAIYSYLCNISEN